MNTIITDKQTSSYIEWSPIIAGTLLAGAVSLLLLQFGSTIGLAVTHLQQRETVTWGHILSVGLWLLWVQLMASVSGGYLAGRTRGAWHINNHESEVRDGVHGLVVWATSSVLAVIAAAIAAFFTALVAEPSATADATIAMSKDSLRKMNVILGFGLAASSIVSALAAWGAATLGGDHRDRAVDSTRYLTFRKKI